MAANRKKAEKAAEPSKAASAKTEAEAGKLSLAERVTGNVSTTIQPSRSSAETKASKAAESKANADAKDGKFGRSVRSGGRRVAQPGKPIEDSSGNEPVHAPDLADNGPTEHIRYRRGAPAPIDLTQTDDEDVISEAIRLADKADVLYYWHELERNSDAPRGSVLGAIRARLLEVQGPPLPDEIENATGSDEA